MKGVVYQIVIYNVNIKNKYFINQIKSKNRQIIKNNNNNALKITHLRVPIKVCNTKIIVKLSTENHGIMKYNSMIVCTLREE